jgi:hypothetical protein
MNIDGWVRARIDEITERIEEIAEEEEHEAITELDAEITRFCEWWSQRHPQPVTVATHAVLTLNKGATMPGAINVDTTNETVTVSFVDDKNDTNAAAPAGVVITFTSDNAAVVTVATDAANPLQGDVTVVAEGTSNLGATLANADGTPLLEADGVTPFPAPATVAVTVSAGAAVGASLVLSV